VGDNGTLDFNGRNETIGGLIGSSSGVVTNNAASTTSTLTSQATGARSRSFAASFTTRPLRAHHGGHQDGLALQALAEPAPTRCDHHQSRHLDRGRPNAFPPRPPLRGRCSKLDLGGFAQGIGSLTGAGNVDDHRHDRLDTLSVGSDNTSPAAFSGAMSDAPAAMLA